MAWTDLSGTASGLAPSPRASFGFASVGGRIYVHGGFNGSVSQGKSFGL